MSESFKVAELVKAFMQASINSLEAMLRKLQANTHSMKNELAQRLDYYKYVASQYMEFYGRKENQEVLKRNLKDYSQYLIEKQKYKFNQKKESIIDKYKYEKYKLLRRLDQSKEELSYKATMFKDQAEKALEQIGN
ncbi:MAG: hypothetical protein HRT47_04650 [Candidatus Caenarcaniphilales bacterium]|nr:hypothetical protein [Candidatus Caenarcaniphilales bacterium]